MNCETVASLPARPVVSVIICTRNRCTQLVQTMRSIGRCDLPSQMTAELLIVDNGSTDGTADAVTSLRFEGMPVRYVCEPRVGKSHAYNTALASARGEYLLFTDDDLIVPANWITGMLQKLLQGQADAVQGGIRVAPHLRRRWIVEDFPSVAASTEGMQMEYPGFLIGANMAMSRRVMEKVPRFDPELGPGPGGLGTCEETLYAWQLIQAGYTIRSQFDVVVEHHFDESRLGLAALAEIFRKMGRSKAYLAYHWEHSGLRGFDWYGCIRRTMAYSWRSLSRRAEGHGGMPPGTWRMPAVEAIAFVRQYARERRRGRRYVMRGLTLQV